MYGACNTDGGGRVFDFFRSPERRWKSFRKGVSETFAQIITAIREKFKTAGTERLLTQAQNQPTESNKSVFQAELETQMNEDETFANKLRELVKQLQVDERVRQVILSGIELSGDLEAEDITQKSMRGGSVKQEMLKDIKAQNIKLGNLTQES